jgi:predicted DNA-binding transcriptional regulator YafY
VVLKAGAWYLIARNGEAIRTYRVSRVIDLDVLDETFERPPGFDLAAFWETWSQRFQSGIYTGEAVIRLSPDALRRMPHLMAPAIVRAARENAGPPDADGWIHTVVPTESLRHAQVEMLKLGADVEVLEPPELRHRIIEAIHDLRRRYGL